MKAVGLIELKRCSVAFGASVALADISLCVQRGERLALVGANGSGKTTLLRLLHGQLRRAEHRAGERLTTRSAQGREISQAMVFQRPFHLRLTTLNNLCLALWLRGVPKPEREGRAIAALDRVGLAAHAHRQARVLSGGQQQRLALARAWAMRPEVLFLDEPTASLDPTAKAEVEALIQTFADDGMTLVMSTHNMGQAKRLASRVIYLEAGRIEADLPTSQFFSRDVPSAAARFLNAELP
jgi:tungstate transport system ATP-binding protein